MNFGKFVLYASQFFSIRRLRVFTFSSSIPLNLNMTLLLHFSPLAVLLVFGKLFASQYSAFERHKFTYEKKKNFPTSWKVFLILSNERDRMRIHKAL